MSTAFLSPGQGPHILVTSPQLCGEFVSIREADNFVTHSMTARRTRRGTIVTRLAGSPRFVTVNGVTLMYHGVGRVSEDPFGLFVSPERFAQQMRALRVPGSAWGLVGSAR